MVLGFKPQFEPLILDGSKKHTIREAKKRLFKEGDTLHMDVNVRTSQQRRICVKQCVSVQTISIKLEPGQKTVLNSTVIIDGREMNTHMIWNLAQNDGFNDIVDFFNFFRDKNGAIDFTGQLIHWTDLRY